LILSPVAFSTRAALQESCGLCFALLTPILLLLHIENQIQAEIDDVVGQGLRNNGALRCLATYRDDLHNGLSSGPKSTQVESPSFLLLSSKRRSLLNMLIRGLDSFKSPV
jgi:hypothetical protein